MIHILLALLSLSVWSNSLVRPEYCSPQGPNEESLYEEDFPWNVTFETLKIQKEEFYTSPRRLAMRAYVNSTGQVVIPYQTIGGVREVGVTDKFIQSVRLHVEEALRLHYVDGLLFTDMGHSNFFVPQKYWDEVLNPIPVSDYHLLYEKMLAHEGLKILYHTAEQLKMKEGKELVNDRHLQWRFFTRNLLGDNEAQGKLELLHNHGHNYNTVHDYEPGYFYWGGGFYISAHEKGCFPFTHQGKTFYFDLNLTGINPRGAH